MSAFTSSLDSNRLFENAFEHAAIGMALVAPDGRWLRVNRSVCELTGYSSEELLARDFQAITHPDDLDLDLANVEKLLRGDISSYQMEKRYLRRDGAVVWASLSVSLVRDDIGSPLFFISQITDITARTDAERQLRDQVAELERLRGGPLTVCAWTKRIQVDGEWLSLDEFLTRRLDLKLTHGMSVEGAKLFDAR